LRLTSLSSGHSPLTVATSPPETNGSRHTSEAAPPPQSASINVARAVERPGFFGQNFGWLVDNISSAATFAIFGIGTLLTSCLAVLVWFRVTARQRAREIIGSAAPLQEVLAG